MSFYEEPSFFIFLAFAAIPAFIRGYLEKPLKRYGFVVSVCFLLLLFAREPVALACLVGYVALSAAVTFCLLSQVRKEGSCDARHRWVGIVCLATPLALYKISEVFSASLLGFIGISYITFKAIQVFLEVGDGVIEKMNLFDYVYFLVFFPVFTSGPIDRSQRFIDDINTVLPREKYLDLFGRGLLLLLLGAVYKVVLATVANGFYTPQASGGDPVGISLLCAIGDSYAYGFYLFFDFAGYSLMAMGAGALLGVHVPRNFRAPFAAIDIKDFWNRWHITLSFWLRDFVFMRFSFWATKEKLLGTRLSRACCGYIVDMGLMGLWHGITLDYVVYGLYHGMLLAANDVYQKKSRFYRKHKDGRLYKALSWFMCLNAVMFGFALFSGQITLILGGFIHGR
ncbi:MAG: D-alanyl-lipoteichoic acid biosynthesis protein DltB [Raoultibacter sp.]